MGYTFGSSPVLGGNGKDVHLIRPPFGPTPTFTGAQRGAVTPYRLATFGDSRANVSSTQVLTHVSAASLAGDKVATQLVSLRGDMVVCFNGGISGNTAANWNSASRISASQDVASLVASQPDVVLIQYGINDVVAGTSSATILGYLQSLVAKIVGAGIFVVFESINTCSVGPASFLNSYSVAGGYSASSTLSEAESKNNTRIAVNVGMKSWMATLPRYLARFVDTDSIDVGPDGFATQDGGYQDGIHRSRLNCRLAAKIIDEEIQYAFPRRFGYPISLSFPNGCNPTMLSPSAGRASGVQALAADAGSFAATTYEIGAYADGTPYQVININCTALASGVFRYRIDLTPDWIGGSPFFTLAAADVMQGAVDYTLDDGSGGKPTGVFGVFLRPRIYYLAGAGNEYTSVGELSQAGSTNYPSLPEAESGRLIAPRLAVKAAKASVDMDTTTAMQLLVYGNATGTHRLILSNPQWAKVA